jgi:hypothetical protein
MPGEDYAASRTPNTALRLTCMITGQSFRLFAWNKAAVDVKYEGGGGVLLHLTSGVANGPWLGVHHTQIPAGVARLNCFRGFANFAIPRLILEEMGAPPSVCGCTLPPPCRTVLEVLVVFTTAEFPKPQ